jgi:hypothetical protein
MSGTKSVFLAKTMNLNVNGTVTRYEGGMTHEIPAEYADSDFVLLHTTKPPVFAPKEGTPEWAEHKRRAEAKRLLLEEVMAEEATKRMRSPKSGR